MAWSINESKTMLMLKSQKRRKWNVLHRLRRSQMSLNCQLKAVNFGALMQVNTVVLSCTTKKHPIEYAEHTKKCLKLLEQRYSLGTSHYLRHAFRSNASRKTRFYRSLVGSRAQCQSIWTMPQRWSRIHLSESNYLLHKLFASNITISL